MHNLLKKELKLCAHPLSFFFISFGLMFFIPGYPVLCGAFFVTLGIFQSFQSTRENNDMAFSMLLPVSRRDIVKGKYLFCCCVELCGFAVMAMTALMRMIFFPEAPAYRSNALMNANFFALGMALVIFGLFNLIFVGGFFKTAYKFGKPFIGYATAAFLSIGIGEALHHFPGLETLNAFGFDTLPLQLGTLAAGMVLYVLLTFLSCEAACRWFEKLDL